MKTPYMLIAILITLSLLVTACSLAATPQPTQPPSPLPPLTETSSPAPLHEIFDLTFTDLNHGWLIGSTCDQNGDCNLALRATQNGGQTWESVPAPHTGIAWYGAAQFGHNVRHLRFADPKNGWAFGPGLFATTDGGQTWSDMTRDEAVYALEPGAPTWAIQGSCRDPLACTFTLLTLAADGRTWESAKNQPVIPGPNLQLVRYGDQVAWILSWSSRQSPDSPPSALAITQDGGGSWQEMASPCGDLGSFEDRLAVLDANQVWVVCGRVPGAGQELKTLFKSQDGGLTWSSGIDLPTSGYVNDLALISPQVGFLGLGRGTVLVTRDGGQTWNQAIPYEKANPGDASGWRILFLDPRHGWASLQSQIFSTSDGGMNWESVQLGN